MIFAVGGLAAKQPGSRARVHEDSAAVEVFHTKKEKWLRGPPLRKPRSGLGVVAVRDGGDTIKENGEEQEEEEAGKDRIGIGRERRRSKTTTRLFAVGGMYGEGVHFFAVPYVEVLDVMTHRDGSLVRGNDDSDGDEEKALRRRKWKRIADLPANRTELSLVVVQGRVYAIGGAGATKTGSTDSMWSLPLFGEDGKTLLTMEQQRAARWRKEPSMPTPRASITSGSLDGKIIVAGGMRGFLASALDPDPLNTVEVFDPATRTWTSAPSAAAAATATTSPSGNKPEQLPQAVHSPGSVVAPKGLFGKGAGKVLVVGGGYASTGDVGAVFGLKESAHGTWAALPPLTVPRMGLALATTQDCLYAIGGMTQDPAQHASMNAASPITASVEKFCPKEGGRTRISRGEEEDDEL
jgi:hypothetical protein